MRLSVEGQRALVDTELLAGLLWAPPMTSTLPAETAPGFLRPGLPSAPASPILAGQSCWGPAVKWLVSHLLTPHILCPSEMCHDCCHPVLTCPLCSQQAASGATALCPLPGYPSVGASPSQGPSPLPLLAFLTPHPPQKCRCPPQHPPKKCKCPPLAFHPVRDYFYNFLLSQPHLQLLGAGAPTCQVAGDVGRAWRLQPHC